MQNILSDAHQQDRALLERVFKVASVMMTTMGSGALMKDGPTIIPFAVIQDADGGEHILQSSGFTSAEDKDLFAQMVQWVCLSLSAVRVAVVVESWNIDKSAMTQTDMALLERLANLGRVQDHPMARECVAVLLQSDAGFTNATRTICRDISEWVVLEPLMESDLTFAPVGEQPGVGTFSSLMPNEVIRNDRIMIDMAKKVFQGTNLTLVAVDEYIEKSSLAGLLDVQ